MPGERLDVTSEPPEDSRGDAARRAPQRFLGVHFQCCRRYARVYINRERTAYVGHCPGCGGRIEFPIGPGGSDQRFFSAY